MGQPSCLDEIMETENPLKGGNDLELQRNSEGSQPTETKDDAEVRNVRFHSSSPRRFWSSTSHAKNKKHSNSIEIHWRAHKSGSVARKPCRRPLECRCGSKCGSSHYQNKNLQKIFTVKGTTRLHQLWPDISSDSSEKGKAWMDFLKTGRSTIREDSEDGECKETIKNANKTLEISMTKANKIKNKGWMRRGSAWIHEKVWKLLYWEIMKITSRKKGSNQ